MGDVVVPRVALAEWWVSDDPRLPVGCRRARDALWDRGRRVGVLHTVALLPTGELDERISVQSPGGVFLVWRRQDRHPSLRKRRVKMSLRRGNPWRGAWRPIPFRPGVDWTGLAILNAWRERPVKMTVTKAMQIINGWDRA